MNCFAAQEETEKTVLPVSSAASHHIPFLSQPTNGQFSTTPLGHCTNRALLSAREVRTLRSLRL